MSYFLLGVGVIISSVLSITGIILYTDYSLGENINIMALFLDFGENTDSILLKIDLNVQNIYRYSAESIGLSAFYSQFFVNLVKPLSSQPFFDIINTKYYSKCDRFTLNYLYLYTDYLATNFKRTEHLYQNLISGGMFPIAAQAKISELNIYNNNSICFVESNIKFLRLLSEDRLEELILLLDQEKKNCNIFGFLEINNFINKYSNRDLITTFETESFNDHFYNFKAAEIENNNNKISNIIFNCTIAVVSVSILTFISLITIGVKVTN